MKLSTVFAAICTAVFIASVLPASAQDRHAGYYYPAAATEETYEARVDQLHNTTKRSRVGFTVGLNAKQLSRGYAPAYHVFAKGVDSEKLIIIAVEDNRYDTLYRLRALAASLTATARTSPLFSRLQSPENLTFYDLCKMAGFKQLTLSNGRDVSHRIWIK
ncbi:MAG: hypothetical protein AAF468_16015 [Pseudomonadota bacterium]